MYNEGFPSLPAHFPFAVVILCVCVCYLYSMPLFSLSARVSFAVSLFFGSSPPFMAVPRSRRHLPSLLPSLAHTHSLCSSKTSNETVSYCAIIAMYMSRVVGTRLNFGVSRLLELCLLCDSRLRCAGYRRTWPIYHLLWHRSKSQRKPETPTTSQMCVCACNYSIATNSSCVHFNYQCKQFRAGRDKDPNSCSIGTPVVHNGTY